MSAVEVKSKSVFRPAQTRRAEPKRRHDDRDNQRTDRREPLPRQAKTPASPASPASTPPAPPFDIPHDMVAALAYELWQLHGGNDVLNWLEAEQLLRRMFADRAVCPLNGSTHPAKLPPDAHRANGM